MTDNPTRYDISVGSTVSIETKGNQGTGNNTMRKGLEILTTS